MMPLQTAPTMVAIRPAAVDDSARVSGWVSVSTTALATVISSPSRIQATPSATTIRVWKGDHGNRSSRAGMRLRMTPGDGAWAASDVIAMNASRRVHGRPVCLGPPTPKDTSTQMGRR